MGNSYKNEKRGEKAGKVVRDGAVLAGLIFLARKIIKAIKMSKGKN